VVRVEAGSAEYSNLINLTTGTATFTMTRDSSNSFEMLIQKMGFNVAELSNTDGIVTLHITGVQLYDPTNGLVTMVVTTPQVGICAAPSGSGSLSLNSLTDTALGSLTNSQLSSLQN
jgi:hypothetical protein